MIIFTTGRNHLYRLAIFLQSENCLELLVVLWPRFKFKKVANVQSLFFFNLGLIRLIFPIRIMLRLLFRANESKILVDVNLLKYLPEKHVDNVYIEMPTLYWKKQDEQWSKEERLTGIPIERKSRVRDYLSDTDKYFERAKHIIVPTKQSQYSLPKSLRVKSKVIPFVGYDLPNQFTISFPKTIEQIICIGLVCPSKGWHYMIQGLNRTQSNVCLEFYGRINQEYRDYLVSLASSSIQLNFNGHVKENMLNEAIVNSDLCIHSSVSEGLPLSLLNSLKAGTPVFCSRDSNMSDILPDVFIYDTYDMNNFAQKFLDLPKNETITITQEFLLKKNIESLWLKLIRD